MSDQSLLARVEAIAKEMDYNRQNINSESTSRSNGEIKLAKAIKELAAFVGVELTTDLGQLL